MIVRPFGVSYLPMSEWRGRLWLCHSDARQVFDLPTANPHPPVSDQIAVVDRG